MSERSVYSRIGRREDSTGIAGRVARISVSAIKQMPVLAESVEGCISLGQGIPSFPTPSFIVEGVIEALRRNDRIGKYSLQPGLPSLKRAVAERLEAAEGLSVDPGRELFISCGAMEALAAGVATVVERGDEVLLPSPNYSSHIEQILFAEGIPVFVPLIEEEGWRLDVKGFEKAVTDKTKAILICSPVNPTGTVFPADDLRSLAEIAIRRNLFVISDEAYDFLTYDGLGHFSVSAIPELKRNLMVCRSFSKAYCMTGWRVGYMYASGRLIDQVLKVHDAFAICAPTISQYAALTALQGTNGRDGEGDRFIRMLVKALDSRRAIACERLDRLSSLFAYQRPKGAYYVFPRITKGEMSDVELALKLLYEAKVITVPGNGFGPTGEGHIRLSFGSTEEEIHEAFDRIEAWAERQG